MVVCRKTFPAAFCKTQDNRPPMPPRQQNIDGYACEGCGKKCSTRQAKYSHKRHCKHMQNAGGKSVMDEIAKLRDAISMLTTQGFITSPYTCPRCGYETQSKANMLIHFERKQGCPCVVNSDVTLTDRVKQNVIENRVYKVEIGKSVKCPDKYDESFYQKVVEEYLGKGHMKLKGCITDVTTDTAHAEIKRWNSFSQAIGQLQYYDLVAPRPELHAYMFDESCGETKIAVAAEGLMGTIKSKLKLFHFTHANNCADCQVLHWRGGVSDED